MSGLQNFVIIWRNNGVATQFLIIFSIGWNWSKVPIK